VIGIPKIGRPDIHTHVTRTISAVVHSEGTGHGDNRDGRTTRSFAASLIFSFQPIVCDMGQRGT
jgi:hypothetical protein